MKVGVLGYGLMGRRRVSHFEGDDEYGGVYDPAGAFVSGTPPWTEKDVIEASDAVVVATPHHLLAPLTLACLEAGKHVFVEKPCARSEREFSIVAGAAEAKSRLVMPGYTLRYYPGIVAAREAVWSRRYGEPLYMRATYGHGGTPAAWHLQADLGGGELLDQGVHLIDLARWFLGDLDLVSATWGAPPSGEHGSFVDHDVGLTLRAKTGQRAYLHASWNEWQPVFRLEVMCERGGVRVTGLDGAYGPHVLTTFKVRELDQSLTYEGARETALKAEWLRFKSLCRENRVDRWALEDASAVLRLTDSASAMASSSRTKT